MEKINDGFTGFDAKREIILSLGVYELRGLARVLGVKSPTTKKREELISQVLSIIETNDEISLGEIEKRGRPFKSLSSVKNILDVISSSKEGSEKPMKFSTYEDIVVFNQDMPTFTLQSSDIFPSNGVFRKGKSFGYFIDSTCQKMVFIAPDQVQKYGLATGDFVDCAVFEINNGDKCFVKKINKINGISADIYEAKPFNDYSQNLPTQVEIVGKKVMLGGRNTIITNTPIYMTDYLKPIISSFKDSKKVFLGVNICFEDKNFIANDLQMFCITSNYSSSIAEGYDRIIDAINFVERMKELNEDIVLFVSDFGNVLNALDTYFQDDESPYVLGHKDKTAIIAKKLISLAMAKSNNKNITSIFVCNKFDLDDLFIRNEVVKISNIIE